MGKLIETDALVQAIRDDFSINGKSFARVKRHIEDAPAVDAVEVVRCKDCAVPHNKWTGCPKLSGLVPPPHFYCYYGERREGE